MHDRMSTQFYSLQFWQIQLCPAPSWPMDLLCLQPAGHVHCSFGYSPRGLYPETCPLLLWLQPTWTLPWDLSTAPLATAQWPLPWDLSTAPLATAQWPLPWDLSTAPLATAQWPLPWDLSTAPLATAQWPLPWDLSTAPLATAQWPLPWDLSTAPLATAQWPLPWTPLTQQCLHPQVVQPFHLAAPVPAGSPALPVSSISPSRQSSPSS